MQSIRDDRDIEAVVFVGQVLRILTTDGVGLHLPGFDVLVQIGEDNVGKPHRPKELNIPGCRADGQQRVRALDDTIAEQSTENPLRETQAQGSLSCRAAP